MLQKKEKKPLREGKKKFCLYFKKTFLFWHQKSFLWESVLRITSKTNNVKKLEGKKSDSLLRDVRLLNTTKLVLSKKEVSCAP